MNDDGSEVRAQRSGAGRRGPRGRKVPVVAVAAGTHGVAPAVLESLQRSEQLKVTAPTRLDDAEALILLSPEDAEALLPAAAEAGVRRVVLVTSAAVYGASPDNPVPLPEDAPLVGSETPGIAELLAVERLAAQAAREHPRLRIVVLRPAAVVGPGVDTVLTRHFEAPRLVHVRGARPRWQFCHVDDLTSAIELAALGGFDGADGELVAAAVGGEGWLEAEEIEQLTGRRRLELPSSVARVATDRMQRLGVTPAAASQLAYLVYPWVVEPSRLLQAGWRPTFTNAEALTAHLADGTRSHRFDRKDAAAGAAVGATLAVVATAAMVRRARKRRRM